MFFGVSTPSKTGRASRSARTSGSMSPDSPVRTAVWKKTLPPQTMGLDALLPGVATFHFMFSVSLQVTGVSESELARLPGVRRVGSDADRTILFSDSQHVLAPLVQLLEKRGADYSDVRTRSPGLEEVFLHLTGAGELGGEAHR